MYCTNCGKEVFGESNYCPYCGHLLMSRTDIPANISGNSETGGKDQTNRFAQNPHKHLKRTVAIAAAAVIGAALIISQNSPESEYADEAEAAEAMDVCAAIANYDYTVTDASAEFGMHCTFSNDIDTCNVYDISVNTEENGTGHFLVCVWPAEGEDNNPTVSYSTIWPEYAPDFEHSYYSEADYEAYVNYAFSDDEIASLDDFDPDAQ